jgi:hypothetical protein
MFTWWKRVRRIKIPLLETDARMVKNEIVQYFQYKKP